MKQNPSRLALLLKAIFMLLVTHNNALAEDITLVKEGGVYYLPVKINDAIELKFVVDTGAADVHIPADVAMTLIRTGTISKDDFLGTAAYQMADGSIKENAKLILKSLQVGTTVIRNIDASIGSVESTLLLGQSALVKLEPWQINSRKHIFEIGNSSNNSSLKEFDSAFESGNYQLALRILRPLAKDGNTEAEYNLGIMYTLGAGVAQDYAESFIWLSKAAKKGYAPAQSQIGFMYQHGDGVELDYDKANSWYLLAAKQDFAEAQFYLGKMYQNGIGVRQDYEESMRWYLLAANKGDVDAENAIGLLYGHGHGVDLNYIEAYKWHRKAAEKGLAEAQFNLGYMYSEGLGVKKDPVEAKKWYKKAALQDLEAAVSALNKLE